MLQLRRKGELWNSFGLIEEPRSKLRGIFDRKEFCLILIRSLTPQHAKHCRTAEPTGNALAVSVQNICMTTGITLRWVRTNQLPPVKRVAWIFPKMGERQRRRHVSGSSGSEPRTEHVIFRTINALAQKSNRGRLHGKSIAVQLPEGCVGRDQFLVFNSSLR
jgi:hypothetical protein